MKILKGQITNKKEDFKASMKISIISGSQLSLTNGPASCSRVEVQVFELSKSYPSLDKDEFEQP